MAFDANKCNGCPIDGVYRPMESIGPEDARFLVVTDVPSAAGARANRLLPPGAMQVFATEVSGVGFERGDFRFTPACRCAYDDTEHTNKEKDTIHKHCRAHLVDEVADMNPEVIIPLGAVAATQAFGKKTKITKVRGLPHVGEDLHTPIFPLTSPGLVVRYPQNAPLFSSEISSLKRFVDADYNASASASVTHGNYRIVTDLQFLIDRNEELISFDTETTGLRWYQGGCDVRTYNPALHKSNPDFQPRFQILTMQFTTKAGEGYMLVWDHPENPIPQVDKPRLRNQLRRLLCDPERLVIGHNTKADNVWLWMTEGIRYRIGGDTLMLATMVDENAPEKNLDVMTKVHVPEMAGYADHFNSTVNKERMWEVPIDRMCAYGCGDTDAAFRLYERLENIVASDRGQWAHYCKVAIPGLNALAAMETRGMFVDTLNQLPQFQQFMRVEVQRQYNELLAQVPRSLKLKHLNDPKMRGKTPEDILSFSRAEFTLDVLFRSKDGFKLKPKVFTNTTKNLKDRTKWIPSTSSKNHLPYFFEECPFTWTPMLPGSPISTLSVARFARAIR